MAKREATPVGTKQRAAETQTQPVNGHAVSKEEAQSPRPDAPDEGRYVSQEEYWATYYAHGDASYEWNNGYLEAKPLSTPVQYRLFLRFLMLLHEYVTTFDNADLMSLETGFTMTVPNPDVPGTMKEVVRKPDLAAIRHDNPVQWGDHDHSYKGICDLCIESLSDSTVKEILRDTKIKKSEYAFAGVKEYYILDPSNAHMHFYTRSTAGDYVEIQPDAAGVIHSHVLPGFQFRLADLQRLPLLEELAFDEVYHAFVLPGYRIAKENAAAAEQRALLAEAQAAQERQRVLQEQQRAEQESQRAEQQSQRAEQQSQRAEQESQRAEQESQRAEQEQLRAEQEQQRAERYAALLRELGVKVDEL